METLRMAVRAERLHSGHAHWLQKTVSSQIAPSPDDHEMNILPVAHAARRGQNASHVMAHPHIAGVQHVILSVAPG